MLTKQAKIIDGAQLARLLEMVAGGAASGPLGAAPGSRHPERDRVMVLLSFRAGLRDKEIAGLTWAMVTDASGEIGDHIALVNSASKGAHGGRTIPLHKQLQAALSALKTMRGIAARPSSKVVYSERGGDRGGYSANSVAVWFHSRYRALELDGASSHSGRRTFITGLAKKIGAAGGSLRDVQEMAGHASLATTQRYIEGDSAAKRNVIGLLG
jgi:integrase/recombinase XerC